MVALQKIKFNEENMDALKAGIVNLDKHIENMQKFGIPVVVTLNAFITDTQEEYEFIKKHCEDAGCEFATCKSMGERRRSAVLSLQKR